MWHGIKEGLDMFLGSLPPCSLYENPQSVKNVCWMLPTNPDRDLSGEPAGQGISDTIRRSQKKVYSILPTYGWALSC